MVTTGIPNTTRTLQLTCMSDNGGVGFVTCLRVGAWFRQAARLRAASGPPYTVTGGVYPGGLLDMLEKRRAWIWLHMAGC